jgi:hypothetical protein
MSLHQFISDVEFNRNCASVIEKNLANQCDQRIELAKKQRDERIAEAKKKCADEEALANRQYDETLSQETMLKQAISEEFTEIDKSFERMIIGDVDNVL